MHLLRLVFPASSGKSQDQSPRGVSSLLFLLHRPTDLNYPERYWTRRRASSSSWKGEEAFHVEHLPLVLKIIWKSHCPSIVRNSSRRRGRVSILPHECSPRLIHSNVLPGSPFHHLSALHWFWLSVVGRSVVSPAWLVKADGRGPNSLRLVGRWQWNGSASGIFSVADKHRTFTFTDKRGREGDEVILLIFYSSSMATPTAPRVNEMSLLLRHWDREGYSHPASAPTRSHFVCAY